MVCVRVRAGSGLVSELGADTEYDAGGGGVDRSPDRAAFELVALQRNPCRNPVRRAGRVSAEVMAHLIVRKIGCIRMITLRTLPLNRKT